MEIGQRVYEYIALVPFVGGLEMLAQTHPVEPAVAQHHALGLAGGARGVELDSNVFLADEQVGLCRTIAGIAAL